MKKQPTGFSLVELLVVVAVVGLLAAIAYPTYRDQIMKAARADAKAALTGTSALLERCFTQFNAYNNAGCTVVLPFNTQEQTYTIQGIVNAGNFTLAAVPINGQANDARCGMFTLNSANVRGVTGTMPVNDCW